MIRRLIEWFISPTPGEERRVIFQNGIKAVFEPACIEVKVNGYDYTQDLTGANGLEAHLAARKIVFGDEKQCVND